MFLLRLSIGAFTLILRCHFFCNHPATTEIYTLSLHDALPISNSSSRSAIRYSCRRRYVARDADIMGASVARSRSEEHTSELQSHSDLVCRLLLEKKKQ